jgi:hypothetical protein
MPTRSELIHKAASLPVGSAERRAVLERVAETYHGDPNVSFESIVITAGRSFSEDVAQRVLRYSTLQTHLKGKPGNIWGRRDTAFGNLSDRDSGRSVAVEVRVAGKHILVAMSTVDGSQEKKWKFPTHETPASIAASIGWYGKQLLTGEE